jgi:hypothetical protein
MKGPVDLPSTNPPTPARNLRAMGLTLVFLVGGTPPALHAQGAATVVVRDPARCS